MKKGCRWRIGNGSSTKVWQVPWLLCPDNGFVTTEMSDELKHTNVQSLLDDSRERWDEEILCDIFNDRDRELIRQIPVSRRRKDDYMVLEI